MSDTVEGILISRGSPTVVDLVYKRTPKIGIPKRFVPKPRRSDRLDVRCSVITDGNTSMLETIVDFRRRTVPTLAILALALLLLVVAGSLQLAGVLSKYPGSAGFAGALILILGIIGTSDIGTLSTAQLDERLILEWLSTLAFQPLQP